MRPDVVLDLAAATLGFLSSVVLLVTAIRAAPLQALLDKVDPSVSGDPGRQIAIAIKHYAEKNLAKVKLWDPRLMYAGIVLLALSFSMSMVKDIFFSGK